MLPRQFRCEFWLSFCSSYQKDHMAKENQLSFPKPLSKDSNSSTPLGISGPHPRAFPPLHTPSTTTTPPPQPCHMLGCCLGEACTGPVHAVPAVKFFYVHQPYYVWEPLFLILLLLTTSISYNHAVPSSYSILHQFFL